ncbi:TrbI/VirB10 family protein [Sphingopyxis sp. KK2]|uniref:TrbI/VirB10 family protein n=1 Tax=Sphingopyxis sp. KK2 TaxID=1855727 RepID=UPI0021179B90|nr:TrbI/VirB10 family protein [Sphingopyxis sp. KK2]
MTASLEERAANAGLDRERAADQAPQASSSVKVDPETLVLRGSPRRVVRFRRPVLIGLAGATAAVIAGLSWFALSPASFKLAATGEEMFEGRQGGKPEALASAPGSYADVPKLGPPLPGDLGRPILEKQREMASAPPVVGVDPGAEAAAAERARAIAEQMAARQSAVLMSLGGARGPAPQPTPAAPVATNAKNSGGADDRDVNPYSIQDAASPWIMTSGSIISASLITGINSDLPGTVVAQVTDNAFDSITGKTLLIPQGARLIGRYESDITFGQRRAFVIWQRIIWPDASSVRIEDMPASDKSGYSGLADRVNFHGGTLLKGVALSTLLGVSTELSLGNEESELARALRESVQQSGGRAGDQLVGRSLDIEPTITIRPGSPLRVLLTRDLILRPWS